MKFFNSDKSGFLSFVAKRMKALFALFFIIAGTSSVWGQNPELSWTYASEMSGWADAVGNSEYTFIRQDVVFAGNNYTHYLDIEFQSAGTDNYKLIEDGKNWYGMETTIPYQCKWWEWKSGAGNTAFQHNAGRYRMYINADSDQRRITVTGIFVTIEEPVQKADGSYTITGRFTNANPGRQNIHTYQIVFSEGVGQGVGANEPATVGEDGSFSITKRLVEGQQYTCCARAIDGIGNHDSEYITFTAEAATSEPEPTVTDLYIFGVNNNWSNPSDEWKCTSVSQDGNVYTWDWSSAPKTFNGSTYFKVGAKNAANTGIDDNNNYGPSGSDVTLDFNGVQSIVQTVVNSSASKAFTVSAATEISKIEFDKSDLTVTFYPPEETQDPVYAATITADASVAEQVSLASTLTETAAGTDLATATCVFQYKAADAGDETYANMSEPASVIYSGEGATRTATLSQSMDAGSYVFRAVWTYNSAEVANAVTETVTIPSDTPTPTDIDFYVRGEKIGCTPSEGGDCWGVASEEFKATSKEGNVYVWNWTSEPKLMVGPFKIADAKFSDNNNYGLDNKTEISLSSEGKWTGTLQVNAANGDMIIPEPGWNVSKITFDYDTKVLIIEAETSSSCQDLVDDFTISGQFNAGVSDGDGLYQGKAVESGDADPKDGYWSDGARYIQLTANSVTANYFDWECVGYAIDNNPFETENIPKINWTGNTTTSARAELSLPGTYKFVCNAKCNLGDDWTQSDTLTITAPVPAMGFDGPAFVGSSWNHASAGREGEGLMTRQNGTLTWKSRKLQVEMFNGEFVVIQRYKTLGCVSLAEKSSDPESKGWTGNVECGESLSRPDNKVNRALNLSFENITGSTGANFVPSNPGTWAAGAADGTDLQLVVTMTDYDSYEVSLQEYPEECQIQSEFEISAQLNAGEASPWVGNVVVSGSNTATGGYFADDHRTVTLSTSQVADNYEWVCVQYTIDGIQQTVNMNDVVTINNYDQQMATATLNLPGDYTFRCNAKCAADADYTESAPVTISVYPAMGMDGPILDGSWPSHLTAGQVDHQLTRETGSLVWSKSFNCYDNGGTTDNYQFVVIQQYKNGCEANQGWAGHEECSYPDGGAKYNNKINDSHIEFVSNSVKSVGGNNSNFMPVVTPSDGALLTLTVTMTGWDSYTVELSKKQEQIFANYSSNDENMGTVTMKVGDTQIDNGDNITAYIGQQVTLTATPAQGYKVASWKINGKETVSNSTTISPTLSGDGLKVVVTFERDCYAGVAYDLTGGGVICAHDGKTELSLNTLMNVTYQLYNGDAPYGDPVQGDGEAAKWTISEKGTYTAKAYDSRYEECEEQAMDMKGSAIVTSVEAPKISVNPGANVHLTVLQARSFTADVPVDWSITDVIGSGDYCKDNGYMISSQTDTSLVAKFLCIGTAKITAAMKAPNQNCKAEVTVFQNGAVTELCAPEPEDGQ